MQQLCGDQGEGDGLATGRSSDVRATMHGIAATLGGSPVGVLVVAQATGRIVFSNAAVQRLLGYSAQALHDQALDMLLPRSTRPHHAGWMQDFFAHPRQRNMGSGNALYAQHHSGEPIAVDIALAPIMVDGHACAIAYLTDLTRQQQMALQLQELFAAFPQGIVLVDEQGTITQTNTLLEQQFGYSPGSLIGQPLEVLLPERFRHGHSQYLRAYAAAPQTRMMGTGRDLMALHSSGTEFPVEIALAAVQFGQKRQLMAAIADVSVRKRAEDALRQTNAQLEEFTYVASHDLRSPLRGIADLLTWIKEDLPPELLQGNVANNFQRVETRIARCEQMIDDLLHYARASNKEAKIQEINPIEAIELALTQCVIPPSFSVQTQVHMQTYQGALTPLVTCLRNLIGNAIKHHHQGNGRILIQATDEGRFAVFSVEDDGPGIPDGAQERIFKLFHRANSTAQGHGVGLAVTRRMVNAHGGYIKLERSTLLGGACFRIYWPSILTKEVPNE
ncbi:PAS domain S-box protein [Curvibacter sp. CHRR-16]|uniref:sensor histidine kinase n=1 Tax=Curvibacter sp. CHRR-16 TaxID=2835872 RepID=UPI001BD976B7|nr:PAS domain S-box protein [Curvibacter sp. CHRR-16]MBT0571767.1 PAS domain S-box protein [Curvibacter sp. CHRR-16]